MGLRQIWILQKSGTCLFNKNLDNSCSDENLISGFLSAVNSFVGSFGAEIKWIETDQLRFVFRMTDHLIFVASTDTSDHAPLTYKRLVRVADHFHMMFRHMLFDNGDPIPIDVFKKINPTITRIFGLSEEERDFVFKKPRIVNMPSFGFDSVESRLMSFIRYRRRVSFRDISQYMKLSENEARFSQILSNVVIRIHTISTISSLPWLISIESAVTRQPVSP